MSDDDLFADSDSDDTAELLASSKQQQQPAAKKKLVKKTITASASKNKNVRKESNAEESGLFDSDDDDSDDDSDDDDDNNNKKPKAIKAEESSSKMVKPMSKRERLEALAKKNRRGGGLGGSDDDDEAAANKKSSADKKKSGAGGYESGDSYDSSNFQRTQDDDDFLDTTGEDPDAVNELYAEQHFDDERPDREGQKKGKKRKVNYDGDNSFGGGGGGGDGGDGEKEPDNPIMAAVHRMKKKKREKKTLTELEDDLRVFMGKMELAADQDEQAIREKKPALQKLANLNEMVETLTRKDSQRLLLDLEILVICKRWIQPLPNRQLGNVTVRTRILDAVGNMTGDSGITPNDLKRSEFGKVVMALYKHKQETPQLKMKEKMLIEQWSRPIFQKSGNMRDLERVASRGDRGLAGLARQHQQVARAESGGKSSISPEDLHGLIASGGKKSSTESGVSRVRVPFSKGFAYSVRPQGRAAAQESPDIRRTAHSSVAAADTRGKLSKRMVEKGRAVGKNQRSANISIEGRATKN